MAPRPAAVARPAVARPAVTRPAVTRRCAAERGAAVGDAAVRDSAAFDMVTDDARAGHGDPGTVAAAVDLGQLDRVALLTGAGRARPDPAHHEAGLALEEPVGADAAGRAALRRVPLERGDLDGDAGGADHHRLAVRRVVGTDRAEDHHLGVGRQADARHAATLEALRAYLFRRE